MLGLTSMTSKVVPSTCTSCVRPVGCRYVRGGNRNSDSAGNADKNEMSGPLLIKESVSRRMSTACRCEREYRIATARLEVVDIGASSVPPC
eukprot:scaffold13716_cov122-Isochrysis_galbana.AAC.6